MDGYLGRLLNQKEAGSSLNTIFRSAKTGVISVIRTKIFFVKQLG